MRGERDHLEPGEGIEDPGSIADREEQRHGLPPTPRTDTDRREALALAWHDVNCAEGRDCRDRALHATWAGFTVHVDRMIAALDASGYDAEVRRQALAPLRTLVELKDGPRDQHYRDSKEAAWQAARDALRTAVDAADPTEGTRP